MDYQTILKNLKKKEYKPIYFLHGEESFFIDVITNYIEEDVLSEAEKSFNQTILYGKETDAKTVIDTAYRYPMMAPRQVVILKEAQNMRSLANLQLYVEKPVETTILVICHKHKKLRMTTKLGKALKKNAVVLEAKKLYDNQVPDWIKDYLKQKKFTIQPDAAALISEYLGNNLAKVTNELDKLEINLPTGTTINTDIVEEHIGISKEYNVFELQKALGQRDILKANRIINYFISNPRKNPLVLVIGMLFNFFSKVYLYHFVKNQSEKEILSALKMRSAYFLKDYKLAAKSYSLAKSEQIIFLLKEYDLKSKGVDFNSTGTPEGALLKEMVWRILH